MKPAAVWVEGSHIQRVAPLSSIEEAPPHAKISDLGDRVVAPAFVNAHTHLAMAVFRGLTTAEARAGNVVADVFFRLETALTEGDVRAFTRLGAYECLLTGSAEVWDHYYFGAAVAEALVDVGMTGVVAPTLQDLTGPGAGRWEHELAATEHIAGSDRLARRGVRAALGPHATDTVSPALLQRAVETAKRLNLPIHMHVAQSFEEVEMVATVHGCSPMELLRRQAVLDVSRVLLVHAVFASAADFALLDPGRHYVGVCPFSQLQFACLAPVEAVARAGIPWVVGTDCVASNDSTGLQREIALVGGVGALRAAFSGEALAHLEEGTVRSARQFEERRRVALSGFRSELSPERLLRRIWGDLGQLSSGALGEGGGVIAPNRLANLVIYDPGHPCFWPGDDVLRTLAYADTSQAIWGMLVAGEWRGSPGDFHRSIVESDEYRESVKEATTRKQALLRRINGT